MSAPVAAHKFDALYLLPIKGKQISLPDFPDTFYVGDTIGGRVQDSQTGEWFRIARERYGPGVGEFQDYLFSRADVALLQEVLGASNTVPSRLGPFLEKLNALQQSDEARDAWWSRFAGHVADRCSPVLDRVGVLTKDEADISIRHRDALVNLRSDLLRFSGSEIGEVSVARPTQGGKPLQLVATLSFANEEVFRSRLPVIQAACKLPAGVQVSWQFAALDRR